MQRCVKENDRWREVRKATEKKALPPQWALFFPRGRSIEKGSDTNTEGCIVWMKAFQVNWYLHLLLRAFMLGKKKKPTKKYKRSGLESAKRKIAMSLRIVIYAGFRFNPGKNSKTHLEKHSELTSHYTLFSTNF